MSLLLVLIIFSSSWLNIARSAVSTPTVVRQLPGFDGTLPFYLETGHHGSDGLAVADAAGSVFSLYKLALNIPVCYPTLLWYVEVDEARDAQMFYYFIKSESKPEEDPVVVWLNGGPGCSAFSGLVFEIGPLKFDVRGYTEGLPSLYYHPYAWTKVSNIIFLDSPVGSGFSYSNQSQGYETSDTKAVDDVYTFIKKWFMGHREFLSNPLYIGGDSYSGIIVPPVAQKVADGNQAGIEPLFNLKGYLVGNPVTDHEFDGGAVVPYVHGMGLISDELYKLAERDCEGEYATPRNAACADSILLINECIVGLNTAHILEPLCFFASPRPLKFVTDRRRVLKELGREHFLSRTNLPLECRSSGYLLSSYWANNDTVREALHIRKGTKEQWRRCNYGLPYTSDIPSSVKFHRNLTNRGYRALVYSGDHDMVVPHVGTQAWIRSLNHSIVDGWRSWSVGGQIAGYTQAYANRLTFATVKGAGHTAPEYKPKECLAMLDRWLSEEPL